MKINVETPYNVGDIIYIFSTENVMKYRDLLISEELTFDKFCEYLYEKHTVEYIGVRIGKKSKLECIMTGISYNHQTVVHIYTRHYDIPHIFNVEPGMLYDLDRDNFTSKSIIKYLQGKYRKITERDIEKYLRLQGEFKNFDTINKHIEEHGFKFLDILIKRFINLIKNLLSEHGNYPINKHLEVIELILPLISLGIIGEITVDEFKSALLKCKHELCVFRANTHEKIIVTYEEFFKRCK